jgi:hypothetical protein
MRIGLFSVLAIVAACNAPGHSRATEGPQSALCAMLALPGRAEAVNAAEEKWGAPAPLLLAFMRQESHFKPDTRPASTSGAYGYPQAVLGTWNHFRKETGQPQASRNDFADSMDFIGWYVSATHERTGAPYSDTVKHYLAYSRGPAAVGPASAAARRNAARVANYAQTYEAELEACPVSKPAPGPFAFLTGAE